MAKQSLSNIIDAADPADREDVAIRRLLVAALSDSGIEFAQMMNPPIPLPSACERGTRCRMGMMQPSRRRRSPVLAWRSSVSQGPYAATNVFPIKIRVSRHAEPLDRRL